VGYQHVQDSASIDMSWSRKRGVKIGLANNIAFQNYAFLGRLIVPHIHFYTPISASRMMRLWLSTYLLELGQEPADYKQVRGKPVPGTLAVRLLHLFFRPVTRSIQLLVSRYSTKYDSLPKPIHMFEKELPNRPSGCNVFSTVDVAGFSSLPHST
jgi:hypothetical protein